MRNLKKFKAHGRELARIKEALCLTETQPGQTIYLTSQQPLDYFATPLLSNSGLKDEGAPIQASAHTLRTGSLLHMAVYEHQLYLQTPERLAFLMGTGPSAVMQQIRLVDRMAEIVRKNPIVQYFLQTPTVRLESEVYALLYGWLPVKVKVDAWDPARRKINDLKSTSCKTLPDFIEKFDDYSYWTQAALYMEVTGADNFYFVGISKSEPHQTFTVDVSRYKTKLQIARRELEERVLARIKKEPGYLDKCYQYIAETFGPF